MRVKGMIKQVNKTLMNSLIHQSKTLRGIDLKQNSRTSPEYKSFLPRQKLASFAIKGIKKYIHRMQTD